jgi:RNA polymerase sigma-70 factor (sigma-E family)
VVGADDGEFDEIYAAHRDRLFRLGVLICGDRARAEDAVAEAFAKVLPRWRGGGVEQPGQYLRQALVNELTGGFRRRAIEQRASARRSGDGRAAERMDALVGERDAMRRALLALPVGQRAVLVLRFYDDLTETETATILGVSLGTVKSRTSRAMARLRGLLEEENIDA